ncbi:MAG: trehalose-6-phosphate synthase [Dehalococcoidia bacterium]
MWDRESLEKLVRQELEDCLFVVVSNREPFVHSFSGKEVSYTPPVGGLTTALDPAMRASGGTWVAWGSGDADREVVDAQNRVRVPPEDPRYTLKRVWLTDDEVNGFYFGFSNEGLWPLCHVSYTLPSFDESQWKTYQKVNQLFADAVLEEIGNRKAFINIQDYHLALVSRMIKSKRPDAVTAQFWHIPWPNPEAFRICPWQEEVLDGLLGNDIMGFHVQHFCNNFLETVGLAIESRIDYERSAVTRGGRTTLVRPFPISVDFDGIDRESADPEVAREMEALRTEYGLTDELVGLGVDRVDYTKGIPERFRALDKLLEKYPQFRQRLVFFELGEISRIHIGKYQEINDEVDRLVEALNRKHGTPDKPLIHYLKGRVPPARLNAFRRLAHFCVVSSLHDGMNLVAKEFPAARGDNDGVLILSRFTGAARELDDAVLVNPYAVDDFAEKIKLALEMPRPERERRMKGMRATVRENNIYTWAASIISEMVKLKV